MKKVRAAIVGYGNIGHFVLEALQDQRRLPVIKWRQKTGNTEYEFREEMRNESGTNAEGGCFN